MPHNRTAVRLQHVLDHAREAADMIEGKSRADLDTDRKLNLALVRLLEIIGESAGRIPPDVCEKHPDVPWHEIVSLRNRLIHGYDSVDFDILWQIVKNDLPPLIEQVEKIVSSGE
jgi:uncharacterized protein with HEPN domain